MHLAGTGTFRPVAEVVFVAVARGIGNCELMANAVRSGPLARSLTFPYHPHVTVAHDVPPDMLELAYSGLSDISAEFRVDHFTEYEQSPSGAWIVARQYPLAAAPAR
jgi:2'-5' RNA ligase